MSNGTLKSEEKSQDARFGYALAAAPDLNHDGFTDLLVGAPLEDEHRGAVYIYHGDGIHIIHDYKQVLSLSLHLHFHSSISGFNQADFCLCVCFSAYSRLFDFPLPAVFWPQCECSAGPGWR